MQSASDYTPTTEEVQRAYRNSEYGGPDTEFDRWLAEVKAQTWEEGWNSYPDSYWNKTVNPYRQGKKQ